MHHAHVSGIEFLPLFVLFYLKALEQRSWTWLAAAALMDALSTLSCWYFFFYAVYFLAFHLLYLRIHDGKWPRGWALTAPGRRHMCPPPDPTDRAQVAELVDALVSGTSG